MTHVRRPDLRSVPVAVECRGDGKAVYACIGDPSSALRGESGVIAFGENLPEALHALAAALYEEVGAADTWAPISDDLPQEPT